MAHPRIVGLETEYGLTYTPRSGRTPEPEKTAKHLFEPVVEWGRATSVFLPNGSRLYLDVGAHPEIATAECSTTMELLEQDRAGERTLERLAEIADAQWEDSDHPGTVHLIRNNVDSAGNAFGCHENYLIPRSLSHARLSEALIPFLVTRPLLCGAGHVQMIDDHPRYVLSPRARHMWDAVSAGSTRSRPMINTRDEPHADAAKFRRLHVIAGDTNMAETSTMLKVVSMRLVLDWVESGAPQPYGGLAAPVDALRATSDDADGQTLLEFERGHTATAVEIQEYFFENARDYAQRQGSADYDPLIREGLRLWERTINAWKAEDLSDVSTTLDYEAKRRLLARYVERHHVDWDHPGVTRLELAYHELGPQSLRDCLERGGFLERLTCQNAVEEARIQPPRTTRAWARGGLITAARLAGVAHKSDWMTFRTVEPPEHQVSMPDPLEPRVHQAEIVASDVLARSGATTGPGAEPNDVMTTLFTTVSASAQVPGGL